jgi:hypothetical protein
MSLFIRISTISKPTTISKLVHLSINYFIDSIQYLDSQNPGAQFSGIQSPQSGGFAPQNTQNFMPQPWQSKTSVFNNLHLYFSYLESQNQTVLPSRIFL